MHVFGQKFLYQDEKFVFRQDDPLKDNGGLDSKYTRKRKLFVAIFECQNRNLGEKVDCSHHIKFFHISSPSGDKYLKRDEKESFTRTRFPEVRLVQTSHS